jgi:hypothetical protein
MTDEEKNQILDGIAQVATPEYLLDVIVHTVTYWKNKGDLDSVNKFLKTINDAVLISEKIRKDELE